MLMEDQKVSFKSSLFLQKIYCFSHHLIKLLRGKISPRNQFTEQAVLGRSKSQRSFIFSPSYCYRLSAGLCLLTLQAYPVAFLVAYRFYFHVLIFLFFVNHNFITLIRLHFSLQNFNGGKIHIIYNLPSWPFLSMWFGGTKYTHLAVKLSSPSIPRSIFVSQIETPYLLNSNSPLILCPGPWLPPFCSLSLRI